MFDLALVSVTCELIEFKLIVEGIFAQNGKF